VLSDCWKVCDDTAGCKFVNSTPVPSLKIYDTELTLAYHDVNGKVGYYFFLCPKEVVLIESYRMEARCLRARCTRLASMHRPLPTKVVKSNRMEKLTTSPTATVGANFE
jgi:hypothetical protein